MITQTEEIQYSITPLDAHRILVEGNKRFVQNEKAQRNLKSQVLETSTGQYPFAVVLSCIDSRVPAELVFDQGIGDIFSVRVGGNIINEDVLGSMEYACKVSGSKIIVVMGHSKCGAVIAACQGIELGNVTGLLSKIRTAVKEVTAEGIALDDHGIETVAERNVKNSIRRIRMESTILAEMEASGEIEIVGAMYSITSGEVSFY